MPIIFAVLGLLTLLPDLVHLAFGGVFSPKPVVGAVLLIAGVVLFIRSRNIANDPVYRVLAHPATITAFRLVRTHLKAAGARVASVDSVVISHRGRGDVWLPVRGAPIDAVLRELRSLAPHAPFE